MRFLAFFTLCLCSCVALSLAADRGNTIYRGADPSASIAAGDHDRDGVPDLLILETPGEASQLTLIADVEQRHGPPRVRTVRLDAAYDDMLIGDFDADGRVDALLAREGGKRLQPVHVRAGDGEPRLIAGDPLLLEGGFDMFVAGEVNRADGLLDIVVATSAPGRAALLVFEGPRGALAADPEVIPLPAPVQRLRLLRRAGGGPISIGVSTDGAEFMVRGRDRMLSLGADRRREVKPVRLSIVREVSVEWSEERSRMLTQSPGGQAARTSQHGRVQVQADGQVLFVKSILSTLIVNDNGDAGDAVPGDGVCDTGIGACTLRAAIEEANALGGTDTIQFALGSGTPLIAPTNALPPFSESATVEGASGGANRVEIRGAAVSGSGLVVDTDFVTLRGLVINGFGQDGIQLNGDDNVVENCYIGIDAAGGGATPGNGRNGVRVAGSRNRVGGSTLAQRNVISGNQVGVAVVEGADSRIQGNLIGLDAGGTSAIPQTRGVELFGSFLGPNGAGVVGGVTTAPGAPPGNIIGGHTGNSIAIGDSNDNLIQGNLLGTETSGSVRLGVGVVTMSGSDTTSNNLVGGSTLSVRNVLEGVDIDGDFVSGTLVQGNIVGLAADGLTPLGGMCLDIQGFEIGTRLTVGGEAPAPGLPPGNIIAGCDQDGVRSDIAGLTVDGNLIGLASDGVTVRSNPGYGVRASAFGLLDIGGSNAGERNVIAGNGAGGISLASTGDGDATVLGNWIGVDGAGNPAPNGGVGISAAQTGFTIGDSSPNGRNVIASNSGAGLRINGGDGRLENNLIGVLPDGSTPAGNGGAGIDLDDARALVGGSRPPSSVCEGVCNLIAHNGGDGIVHDGTTRVIGNEIRDNGGLSIDIPPDGPDDPLPGRSLNRPVILSVTPGGVADEVAGTLSAAVNQSYDIHLYAVTSEDPSGFGNMNRYLGETPCVTDGTGSCSWLLTVDASALYTATSTSQAGFFAGTSELAPNSDGESSQDSDADGVPDDLDNCVLDPNPQQEDADLDGVGDVCDVCPMDSDPAQADTDLDGLGDACDNCPEDANANQSDLDNDQIGDTCDCAPNVPGDSPPDDPSFVLVAKLLDDAVRFSWPPVPQAESYSVTRGSVTLLGPGQYGSCFLTGLQQANFIDGEQPSAGDGFHYLVKGVNGCGSGTLGSDSSGSERVNENAAACP